jgi:hypothetical protein
VTSQRPSRRASLEAWQRDSLRTGKTAEVASPAESEPGRNSNALSYPTPTDSHSAHKSEFPELPNNQARGPP